MDRPGLRPPHSCGTPGSRVPEMLSQEWTVALAKGLIVAQRAKRPPRGRHWHLLCQAQSWVVAEVISLMAHPDPPTVRVGP
mmetsp:Transcript_81399/g.225419  ORF Transcript_81399/g.225419 Transcript_81399/m.225419 type:complete len:81 (+) Transcript_81399:1700-1942(+)